MSVASTRRVIAGYELHSKLGAGGMASVHLGRSLGPNDAGRLVAVKRLHEHLARDPAFASVFLQEARITERIDHRNVVRLLDVVALERELLLVMEYVPGQTVAGLMRAMIDAGSTCSVEIAASVIRDTLRGLEAAHTTKDAHGQPLRIVHRDVSPQNIIVAASGVAKLLDFGIAKVIGSQIHTRTNELKGKIAYMAPEVLQFEAATPQADVWATAVTLWEILCAQRLFKGDSEASTWAQVMNASIPTPGEIRGAPTALDDVVMRGLSRDPAKRYQRAAEMADDIERALVPAPPATVAAWVDALAARELATQTEMVKAVERTLVMAVPPASVPAGESARSDAQLEASSPDRLAPRARAAWPLLALLATAVVGLLAWRAPIFAAAGGPSPPSSSRAVTASPHTASPPATDTIAAAPVAVSSAERAPSKPRRPRSAPRTRATRSCDPPYVVDSAGRKVFKLDCVR